MSQQPTIHLPRRIGRRVIVSSVAACALGLTGVGLASHGSATTAVAAQPTMQTLQTQLTPLSGQSYPDQAYRGRGFGGQSYGQGYGSFGTPSQTTTETETEAADATDAQESGLVYITTELDYGAGEAAGTGMVLTSDGEILTNHHVIEGATSISVQVISTGTSYEAEVVGYDSTHDVAVLQLEDASGLTTVSTDTSNDLAVGDDVTGVGNANGDGGAASASPGTVMALDQSITVSSETGGASSELTGLIEVDADIIAGDSGGALYNDEGKVVGMNTAASSGTADITGYAVPISEALSIAEQITSGTASDSVQIGNHGYLGVQLASSDAGALVAGVVTDSPAAHAGLEAGSTIASIDGTAVTSADALADAVARLAVGDRASIAWTDSLGQSHTATIVLGTGPVG